MNQLRLESITCVTDFLDKVCLQGGAAESYTEAPLMDLVYCEMRRIATQSWVRSLGGDLSSTELISEVWVRILNGQKSGDRWKSREHFFNTVARKMQQVIIDRLRELNSQKRGGAFRQIAHDIQNLPNGDSSDIVIKVAETLDELENKYPITAQIVRLKFFSGYTHDEISAILGITVDVSQSHWSFGRTWIKSFL